MDSPENRERSVVLVTGADGLIGRRLVKNLTDSYQVIGLDLQQSESEQDYVHWLPITISQASRAPCMKS